MSLIFLPCSDSPEAALAWKVSLDLPRGKARQLGESAVAIIAQVSYAGPSGELVSIKDALDARWLREQSISSTTHRYGQLPNHLPSPSH